MPNWCDNEIIITGPASDLEKILDMAKSSENNLFDLIKQTPADLLENQAAHDKGDFEQALMGNKNHAYGDWYSWRIANWGTKWNPEDITAFQRGNSVVLGFNTAWSPAIAVFEELGAQYPEVSIIINYYEEGMGFIGQALVENGELQYDDTTDISSEMLAEVGAVLDEDGNVDWDVEQDYDLSDIFVNDKIHKYL